MQDIIGLVQSNMILWIFILSLLSNSIPYIGIPYLVAVAAYGGGVENIELKILVAIVSGLGAALGKIVVYSLGRGVHAILPSRVKENLELFSKIMSKGVFIATLIFAATPLPDDVLYVPLGIAKYSLLQFFIAVCIGKIILTSLVVAFGTALVSFVGMLGINRIDSIIVLIVVSIVLTLVVARMDWSRVIREYIKNPKNLPRIIVEELVRAINPLRPMTERPGESHGH